MRSGADASPATGGPEVPAVRSLEATTRRETTSVTTRASSVGAFATRRSPVPPCSEEHVTLSRCLILRPPRRPPPTGSLVQVHRIDSYDLGFFC